MLDTKYYDEKEIPLKSNSLIKWLWYFISPFKTQFYLFTLNRIFRGSISIATPVIIGLLVDFISSPEFFQNQNKIYFYIGIYLILMFFRSLVLEVIAREENNTDWIAKKMTIYSLEHLMNLDMKWHQSNGTGGKMQNILIARQALRDLLSTYYRRIIPTMGALVAAIVVLFIKVPITYAIIISVFSFFFLFTFFITRKKIVDRQDDVNNFFENVVSKIYDFSSNIVTIKTLNLISYVRDKALKSEYELQVQENKMNRTQVFRFLLANIFIEPTFALLCILCVYHINIGLISVGDFVIIIGIYMNVSDLIENLAESQETFFRNLNGFSRLTTMLNQKIEEVDFAPYINFPKNWEQITYKNVSFSYNKKVLNDINFEIKRGEKIAIVGHSGSGKTTTIKLLLKQILAKKGDIFVDDINYKNIKKEELIDNISVILQDSELFDISIKDNILLKSKYKEDKLEDILKFVNAWDFIQKMPDKENSMIGEKGVRLSGGEKQRILMARAIAQNSDIVILDEATNALDSENEFMIQETIKRVFDDKTLLIIAHRLSTIKDVDRILVFEDGKIVETGSFKELLSIENGHFAKLWNMQKLD